jgi:hypothetical protein
MKVLAICLIGVVIALFWPKKKKKVKLTLHQGGKYDPFN